MTAPAAIDSRQQYSSYRIALASGVIGSVGATLGWLAWLSGRLLSWDLVGTVLIGGAVGYVIKLERHYVRVAKLESQGHSPEAHAAAPHESGWRAWMRWILGFSFLGLVTEHLVAHMAAEFFHPFLASLTTLFPAGMILGYTMNRGRARDEKNLFDLAFNGLLVGVAIAVVTGLVWSAIFGTAPWRGLFAWWTLIGVTSRVVTKADRNAVTPGDPVAAVVLAFAVVFVVNLLPVSQSFYDKFGPFRAFAMETRIVAGEIELSPNLHRTFWMEAEREFAEQAARERAASAHGAPTAAKQAAPAAAPAAAPQPAASANPALSDQRPLAERKGMKELLGTDSSERTSVAAKRWSPMLTPEFIRSWLVLLLFAIGVGIAPGVERSLRPMDYPSSRTFRNDIRLSVGIALLFVLACAIERWPRTGGAATRTASELERAATKPAG